MALRNMVESVIINQSPPVPSPILRESEYFSRPQP
jgi:hypothetical protein